ncbi:hypothetical protein M0811_05170 [Anaeramoeba ignava]|uniref:Uncharacterized protein n=1 Tax=Anaeramoeba ignava TaxID=1746090 RepID=A0A9Q0LSX5_ANAIG|nr:hypothetical protein M0811_05170 [Anaeramoeba ignava]
MLSEEDCSSIDIQSLSQQSDYQLVYFYDHDSFHHYCILYEVSQSTGLGTFVVNLAGTIPVSIGIPHPIYDSNTELQGAGVFKKSGAQTLLISGIIRNACNQTSECQSGYYVTDPAHNINNGFFEVVMMLKEYYEQNNLPLLHLQLHGMSEASCSDIDVLLSSGLKIKPDNNSFLSKFTSQLRTQVDSLDDPWFIFLYQDDTLHDSCDLYGTSNTEGRGLNGVDSSLVCSTSSSFISHSFIHAEQKYFIRQNRSYDLFWANALKYSYSSVYCLPIRDNVGGSCLVVDSSSLINFSQFLFLFIFFIFFIFL